MPEKKNGFPAMMRVSRQDGGTTWVNPAFIRSITTDFSGPKTLGGFIIEFSDESDLVMRQPDEVHTMAKALGYVSRK